MTLKMMTVSTVTPSIKALGTMTTSITAFCIDTQNKGNLHVDTRYNNIYTSVSIMTICTIALSIITVSVTTLNLMILSIIDLIATQHDALLNC
jgi:hypothetical protein